MPRFANLSSTKVKGSTKLTSQPYQTDYAEFITGQAESEKAGKLWIEESFDLPVFPGALINSELGTPAKTSEDSTPSRWEGYGTTGQAFPTAAEQKERREAIKKEEEEKEQTFLEKWAAEGHWSICTYPEKEDGKAQGIAEFTVAAKKTLSFSAYAGAPFWRLVFEPAEESKSVRIFARAFERGRV